MCDSIELPNNWSMINGLARRIRVAVESHSPGRVSHAKLLLNFHENEVVLNLLPEQSYIVLFSLDTLASVK